MPPSGELTEKALEAGATALALDEQDHWGHLVLGLGHARQRRPDDAVRHLSHCVDISPNFALGHAGLGYALACGGQPQRGLEALERAWRLGPLDPFLAIYAPVARYMALFALERYDEAIAVCRSVAARARDIMCVDRRAGSGTPTCDPRLNTEPRSRARRAPSRWRRCRSPCRSPRGG